MQERCHLWPHFRVMVSLLEKDSKHMAQSREMSVKAGSMVACVVITVMMIAVDF